MKNSYDVIVVGAGPAGSAAARHAALGGASVLLLEKDRDIGVPVRCAEGVTEAGLKNVLEEIDPRWIMHRVNKVMFHSPSGIEVELDFNQTGYILNRKLFDYDLAQRAVAAGADVLTKAYVFDLLRDGSRIAGVKFKSLGRTFTVSAKVVIGADGVESRVGRWAGLKTRTKLCDMETCAQYLAGNIDASEDHLHLYFSNRTAPQGYLWIFPKGNGVANIGLGISGEAAREKPPIAYLQEFMAEHFPQASVLSTVIGGVPCDQTLEQIVADGLMLVGDAAHQVNPITGGGIVSALLAGKIAGQVAAKAVALGSVGAKVLQEYPRQWSKSEGKNHAIFYKLKSYIYKLSDEELDDIARAALGVPLPKRSMLTLFRAALVKRPSLILDAVKVFT
ncbi:MAG: NAD(P)/FAD-dependent oxidoreductase [candidate division KSB1 bacterium]|nr:NAD(P)/FAD-dependent oxidoreductase [candidate division KSB1 bacterium]